jgi:tetratricopeptide (TPR) repeat protein
LCCLYKYFLVISDKQSMLKLAEEINEALGKFPVEFTQGELEEEVMIALDLLAHAYLETKQFDRAKQNYQKKLEVISALQSIDARRKGIATASTYHNLGLVAQELREWDDARHNYHQSLAICVEFGDQYSQASTYHNLGIVAQELRELDDAHHNYHQALAIKVEFGDRYSQASTYAQLGLLAVAEDDLEAAIKNLLQALQIFADFKDEHSMAITIRNLSHLYQSSQNPEVIAKIAEIFGASEVEVQQGFDSMNQGT